MGGHDVAAVQPVAANISSPCIAQDKLLHDASDMLGRRLGIQDLQLELRDRGHAELARRAEALNRARRQEALPDVSLLGRGLASLHLASC